MYIRIHLDGTHNVFYQWFSLWLQYTSTNILLCNIKNCIAETFLYVIDLWLYTV